MRQEFLNIVSKLKSDKYCAISVINDSTMNKILTTTTGSELVQKYGSVENYFESLKNSGVTEFSIQEYRKNGTGWKNTGNVVKNLTFQEKNTAVNPVQAFAPAVNFQSLSGAGNQQVVGLGFYEAANLMADSKESARLAEENKYVVEENKRLKEEILVLKEEKLKREYDTAGKETQNSMILGVIQNLPAILSGLKSSPSPSLNAPAQENLSQVKTEMMQFLSQPTVSDSLVQALYEVATKIATENGFYEKLEELLNPQQPQ